MYALVSDLSRLGEWSPENTGGRWVDRRGEVLLTIGGTLTGVQDRVAHTRRMLESTPSPV